jgi:myo-inositol 2-dehydrogenase / D-chiro-inositol 1-dehydrogenase
VASSHAILGVGIVGAGPVTQAIHLPTLARLTDRFRVVRVMDVSAAIAGRVAASADAQASTTIEELLSDPDVDVVAICSPPQFHADQIVAAMEAGKKAVLCEKPLATTASEAQRIADASARTGVPFIVGAMHVFDHGWVEVSRATAEIARSSHTIRSRILIPLNSRFEDWASEILNRPEHVRADDSSDPLGAAQAFLRNVILGLTVHDLPLVRAFVADFDTFEVDSARLLEPFGYLINARTATHDLQFVASVHGHWDTDWELEVISDTQVLTISFPPSFVNARSAVATLCDSDGSRQVFGPYESSGYEAEWHALYDIAHGEIGAGPTVESFIADLAITLKVADQATAALAEEYRS